jgi:hypothetical protein
MLFLMFLSCCVIEAARILKKKLCTFGLIELVDNCGRHGCRQLGSFRKLLVFSACVAVHCPHLRKKIGDLGLRVNCENVFLCVRLFQPAEHRIVFVPVCRRRAAFICQKHPEATLETPDVVVGLEEGMKL